MRKIIVALSIVLIFSGLIGVSFYNMPQLSVKEDFVRAEDKWQISRNDFKAGENLSVGFNPGSNWAWPPHDSTTIDGIEFPRVKLFIVKVTDTTTDKYTEFEITLIIPGPETSYDPGKIRAYPKIKVLNSSTGGMIVENYPIEIGGIVEHNGNYTVKTELYPDWIQNIVLEDNKTRTEIIDPVPPSELRLYRVIEEKVYPYTALMAFGPMIMGTGVVALVWSARKTKRRATHKMTLERARNMKNR